MSKRKVITLFQHAAKSLNLNRYVASINQRWFKRIMNMVPRRLLRNQKEIKKIHEEIKESFNIFYEAPSDENTTVDGSTDPG